MSFSSADRYAQLSWQFALALGSVLLAACSSSHEPPARGPAVGPARVQVAPTTDVPALLGKSIDDLRQQLGARQPLPSGITAIDTSTSSPDSLAAFHTGGLTLVASYDARSREVRDLLLLGSHEDSLMGRANLRTNATNYIIMPVFYGRNSHRLLGLRIIAH
jgi:hypothetical protein